MGIEPERTIHDAAAVVDQTGVGTLVVTDRDLVRRCLAKGLLADAGTDGIMTSPGVIIDAEADLPGGPFLCCSGPMPSADWASYAVSSSSA